MSLDPEAVELLARHGLTPEDIARVGAFEDIVRPKKKSRKIPDSPLDFGDWTP